MNLESGKADQQPKPPAENSAFLDKRGVEQPFSKEGLLNRNFGKDATVPSEAVVFSNGMLNRPKVERDKMTALREKLGLPKEAQEEKGTLPADQVAQQESAETASPQNIEGQSLRDRFLEHVESNKQNGVRSPAWAAVGAIHTELQLDSTMSDEERQKRNAELQDLFASYQRNVRETEAG